jgi:hypothetical protein
MKEKKPYGEICSEDLSAGDIVEWRRWDSLDESWTSHYGVVIESKNKFMSNRLVSISTVLPIDGNDGEIELFSLSLRLVSRASEQNQDKLTEQ